MTIESTDTEDMLKNLHDRLTNLENRYSYASNKFFDAEADFRKEVDRIQTFEDEVATFTLQVENHIDDDHFVLNDEIKKLQKDSEALIQLKYKYEDLQTLCGKLTERIEELERTVFNNIEEA